MADGETNKAESGGQSKDQEYSRINYEKLRRENEKLQYEIEELRRWREKLYLGFFSALLSPIIGVLTFLIGLNASKGSERIQALDASYQQLLKGVGSPSPAERLVSITGLQRFIAEPPKKSALARIFTFSPLEDQEEHARKQRADDAVELLVARLKDETDLGVSHASLEVVAAAQHPPIKAIATINRAAALSFARSSGRLSALMILESSKKRGLDQDELCDKFSVARSGMEEKLSNLVLRAPTPYDGLNQINSAFLIRPFLYATPFNNAFSREQRDTLNDSNSEILARKRPPTDKEIEAARREFRQLSLFVQETSAALELALHTTSGKLRNEDLSGIALVSGDLKNVDLSGAKLDNSYISVVAGGTSFDGASLVGSNLTNMKVDGRITFGSAILHDSMVPDAWSQPGTIDSDIYQIIKTRKDKPAPKKSGPSPFPPNCAGTS
jgi:hypothetical protein